MRQVLYMAHPVAPTTEEILEEEERDIARKESTSQWLVSRNAKKAMQWLSWLRKSFPETTFISPWISSIMAGDDDSDPRQRESGLVDCCAVVERCDGIVLVGGRISSGMRREMEHGKAYSHMVIEYDDAQMFEVYDLTCLLAGPDGGWKGKWAASDRGVDTCPVPFDEWAKAFR